MKKAISLIALLGGLISGTMFADIKQGFEINNQSGQVVWVNVGNTPSKTQEIAVVNPRGYKVIKPGETKKWSFTLGKLPSWSGKLWIRTPESKTAYGFFFPSGHSTSQIDINSATNITVRGTQPLGATKSTVVSSDETYNMETGESY